MAAICSDISVVALAVWPASDFTSEATTANPASGVAGACCLNGGVQRQQVGLGRDALDQRHDVADLLRALGQRTRGIAAAAGIVDRARRDLGRLRDLTYDFRDR